MLSGPIDMGSNLGLSSGYDLGQMSPSIQFLDLGGNNFLGKKFRLKIICGKSLIQSLLVGAVIQMPHALSFPKDLQLLDGQSGLQVCWLLVWCSFWFSDSLIQDAFLSEIGCGIVCRLLKIRVIIQVIKMTAN